MFDRICSDPNICHGKVHNKGIWVLISVILDNLTGRLTFYETLGKYLTISFEVVQTSIQYASYLTTERIIPIKR